MSTHFVCNSFFIQLGHENGSNKEEAIDGGVKYFWRFFVSYRGKRTAWDFPYGRVCNFWVVLQRNSNTRMAHGQSHTNVHGHVLVIRILSKFATARKPHHLPHACEAHTHTHTAWHTGVWHPDDPL